MHFDIITIFPEPFEAYFNESILRRAREKKFIEIKIWNLRDFAKIDPERANDKFPPRRQIDNRPFGGGPGMVIGVEPLVKALEAALGNPVTKSLGGRAAKLVVSLDAGGKQFDAKMAATFPKKYKHIIFICGRYEGVDERIKQIVKAYGLKLMAISVGPYVLTGGELPAMIMIDSVARHIPGVLGKNESLEEKRYGVGVPVYTRPEVFKWPIRQAQGKQKLYRVPKVLLSGNHKNIEEWRRKNIKKKEA
ncbi:hypothetical protein A2930_00925 [Candidatus Giovannonibacteria bacterium RIFCSPLOWO2_01_FULL_45_34]|uniref:tRNA (guanine-N(1)-)-methyltransferase n=1 Tax=Candidatus Giovannonibacteria bacterium RIFCSPLOWO2_01_FULL_45_34 TaxID=1798351 RepID=A0A1F5WY54_9BACT|nr:MAG: hypothetical protein A3C73_04680 [Candidatus Giovannonibacteria bacterium RIFCSPHIGHO2_02_FULL_44_11]OGF80574.1 MAG: hypothetical protein A2930_00925 [Candidatus Giovannonibacteria bacterium RIFCSPLOWO2_01_FULL_45_34]